MIREQIVLEHLCERQLLGIPEGPMRQALQHGRCMAKAAMESPCEKLLSGLASSADVNCRCLLKALPGDGALPMPGDFSGFLEKLRGSLREALPKPVPEGINRALCTLHLCLAGSLEDHQRVGEVVRPWLKL